MSASPELRMSPVALGHLFPRPPPAAPQAFQSPTRQVQHQLLPADDEGSTAAAASGPVPAAGAAPDDRPAAGRTTAQGDDDDFSTPTGDAHRIPSAAADPCACPPPAPRKPRPPAPAAPSCRRRLIEGELLRVPAEEVERLFGRAWTRTPPATPTPPVAPAGPAPAVLPAKKRKRCYAEAAVGGAPGRD